MAIAEKEIHKSLVQKFVRIIEEDKKRKVPVIKYIRPGYLLALTQRFKGNKNKIHFSGIIGESASGKSTFVRTITKKIKEIEEKENKSLLNFISTDNYFNDISEKIKLHGSFDNFLINENYNPDAPENFKLDLMRENFTELAKGNNVYIPEYKVDGTGISVDNAIFVKTAPIILTEGIAVFYPKVRDLFDIRFYVEVDEDLRLERYIKRAINSRNQTEEDARKQYVKIAECAAIHLRPQRKYADVIINGHASIADFAQIAEDFGNCF